MSKRFTCTDKWKKFFLRGLQGAYKLLWFYILDDCDHAGIWHVEFDIAQIRIGKDMEINSEEALRIFKEQIIIFDNGRKWFIPSFVEFQYGELNPENRVHKSVINLLKKYKLFKGYVSPLQGAMDKDKDKDKDKDFEKKEKNKLPTNNIFNHWNSLNIIVHQKLTESLEKIIKKSLKEHTEKEIISSMDNYSTIIKDDSYFYSYPWNLKDFLSRGKGMPEFLENGGKWIAYKNRSKKSGKPKAGIDDAEKSRKAAEKDGFTVFREPDSMEGTDK